MSQRTRFAGISDESTRSARESTLRSITLDVDTSETDALRIATTTVQAVLQDTTAFTDGQCAVLAEWLERIQKARPRVLATTVSRRRLPLLLCPAGKEPTHFPSARW